jgi:hypothetical protein
MEAQNSKIQSEGWQQNLFSESANRPAIVKKTNRIMELEQQLAHSEAERRRLLQRYEYLIAMDEERQKAFRWSFAC